MIGLGFLSLAADALWRDLMWLSRHAFHQACHSSGDVRGGPWTQAGGSGLVIGADDPKSSLRVSSRDYAFAAVLLTGVHDVSCGSRDRAIAAA